MLKEFRDFIAKGNMVEIAIGLLIAGAFGALVTSLTKNLINPIIGLAGKQDFNSWYLVLRQGVNEQQQPVPVPSGATLDAAQKTGAVVFAYGAFLSDVVNFLIVAFVIFMILKMYKKVTEKPQADNPTAPPQPTTQEVLLTEIRDLLKSRQ